jgi:hypothetical protein
VILQRDTSHSWSYRGAIVAQALIFHRHVLFYAKHLFPWDFRGVHLPLATLLADSFRRGQWPLWDPLTYCGMTIAGNVQAASFYPPVLAATAAAARLGDDFLPRLLAISVVLQIIFAGLCTFELMRRLEVGPAAAWIGATVFELGCFFAAQVEHMGAIQGAVWLPLIWLSVLRLRTFKKPWRAPDPALPFEGVADGGNSSQSPFFRIARRWFAVLVVSLAMTVLAGLPQVAVAAFGSAICLAVLLALFRWSSWKAAAMVALACAWAVLLAAIQFGPTAELTRNSVAKYRAEWLGSGGGMPPGALFSLVIPNYWHVFDPSNFHGPADPTFLYLYSSLLGLALAIGTIFWKPPKAAQIFGALLATFTFAMLGDQTWLGRAMLLGLPEQIRIGIHPDFFFCVFSLVLAVLAGLGAERLLRSSRLQIVAGAVIACDLILVSSGRPMNEESAATTPGFTHESADGSAELLTRIREITNRSVPPSRYDIRPEVWTLWSNVAPIIGIPTSNGCDPMAPERTIQARLAFAKGPRWGTCYQVENPASPVLSLMNAGVVLSRTVLDSPGLHVAGEVAGYRMYDNLDVMDRFFFAKRVRSAGNLAEAADAVHAPDFRPAEEAIVEARGEQFDVAYHADDRVQVISYAPTAIRLETDSAGPAFLVATDSYYPGWEATVDGSARRIYATDAAFRGLRVPGGKHTIDFRFVPRTLYWSAAVSALALMALLILCFA